MATISIINTSQLQVIADKLADMQTLQTLMISNEEKLIQASAGDPDITERLTEMLKDDRNSIATLQEAITKLGVPGEASDKVQEVTSKIEEMMAGSKLALYEKFMQHEALKHQLVMTGLLVHKSAQAAGDDLEKVIDPINKANFLNRKHQEILKGILIRTGTRELVGKESKDDIWAQAEDGVAALKGAFGGLFGS
ncbi:MAG: hemerythrin HHE cation-binding protein [Phormidesmis priestleyi]|uniref:Hemerythrin HHE cation-binding protein n=1 Tax=Phormidesmis priestleyi TaxID=268141 RepID=A0A2W4XCF6_9CYAN|nr:MAG: hemerythrin HHE cation-binding protein [Phormidesmis priestleyi]